MKIDDIQIIVVSKGKHYTVLPDLALCKQMGVNHREVRLELFKMTLLTHKVLTPSLEDIHKKKEKSRIIIPGRGV
jgi:hypothetical protein